MELPRYAQPYAVISASSNVLFNGFSGVENVQFLEEEAELLFKMLVYRLFFLFRKVPELLSKWTRSFFARHVQELFSIHSCFPFFLTIVFYPLVHILSKRVRHSVIDDVLKTGGQVNFKRFMLWKLIKQFIGECGGAMLHNTAKMIFFSRDPSRVVQHREIKLHICDAPIGQGNASMTCAGLHADFTYTRHAIPKRFVISF